MDLMRILHRLQVTPRRLGILSDLHLEVSKAYDVFEVSPSAPYLALLGDIGSIERHKKKCLLFLTRQLRKFQAVFFVPGNHEAYHSTWSITLDLLREFEGKVRQDKTLGEFVLLDRASFRIPISRTVILGCSLFSFIPPESEQVVSWRLNDFSKIKDWDVPAHNSAHAADLAWLNQSVQDLQDSDVEIVILTHWSPTRDLRSVDPRFVESPITSAFATDLSNAICFQSTQVKIWAFGHTHYNCNFAAERETSSGPLRLVTNQRGYYFAQAPGFVNCFVIDV